MILVDGIKIKSPSSFTWGLSDISDEESGRTLDDVMHKNRTSQKRKLSFGWSNPTREEAAAILQAFNPEYIMITYPDTMSGNDEVREFYIGDRTAPIKTWTVNKKIYSQLSFDAIER